MICVAINFSPKIKKAKIDAPIGSNNTAIEITLTLTHLIDQLNNECPNRFGIMARSKNQSHVEYG